LSLTPFFLLSSLAPLPALPSFPTRRSSDLTVSISHWCPSGWFQYTPRPPNWVSTLPSTGPRTVLRNGIPAALMRPRMASNSASRSEEHTSELQSRENLVCRLLLEKKNQLMD